MVTERDTRVAVVIPVKRLADAKSRTGLPAPARADLALDLVGHTVSVAARCRVVDRVVVVTSDATVAVSMRGLGVVVLGEPAPGGLDLAARRGISAVRSLLGVSHAGVLVSDLPELTVGDLGDVVTEYVERRVPLYVTDQHRTGTTFLLQATAGDPETAFGPGSARRHERLGFRPATSPAPGLRFDIDTADDLRWLDQRRAAAVGGSDQALRGDAGPGVGGRQVTRARRGAAMSVAGGGER